MNIHKKGLASTLLAVGLAALWPVSIARAGLLNPDFEYGVAPGHQTTLNDASVNAAGGWFTTELDHQIEVWGTNFRDVTAYSGSDFVEINANAVGTLYQKTSGFVTGEVVSYQFAHRGRSGVDVMAFDVTDVTTGVSLFHNTYSDGNSAWGFYAGSFTVGASVATTDIIKFGYTSVSSAGGDPTVGNFLDDANYAVISYPAQGVAEPVSAAILGSGLLGLVAARGCRTRLRTGGRPTHLSTLAA